MEIDYRNEGGLPGKTITFSKLKGRIRVWISAAFALDDKP